MRTAPPTTSLAAQRGVRFSLDPAGGADGVAGLRFGTRGGLAVVDGADAVRQAIVLLLSTRPGERVMRPAYGCALHRLQFLPLDETTLGLAQHYVAQAVERWEPRVKLRRVAAEADPGAAGVLLARVEYELRPSGRPDEVVVGYDTTAVAR